MPTGYRIKEGKSIIQLLEDDLLAAYEKATRADVKNRHRAQGVVAGLAWAIAKLRNPYAPNTKPIMREVKARFKAVHEQAA